MRAGDDHPPGARWAVLVYMAADTNLEDATLGNLEEILDVGGSTPRVRVITLVDRSTKGGGEGEADEGYTDRAVANLADWSGAKLLEPLDGELRELADWGPTNMGDPAVLRRFIEEATRRVALAARPPVRASTGTALVGEPPVPPDRPPVAARPGQQVVRATRNAPIRERYPIPGADPSISGNLKWNLPRAALGWRPHQPGEGSDPWHARHRQHRGRPG